MIPTGIPGFDELVGGLPKGELVIIAGGPGTGKTMFSAGFLYWGAVKYGERGVYVSLAEDRGIFLKNMRKIGFDFEKLEKDGLFRFLDMLTLMEAGTSQLIETIIEEVTSFNAQRLVIDSLSALAQGFKDSRELRVFLHSLLGRIMKATGCTTVLIEEVPHGRGWIGYGFEEFVASAVILLERDFIEDKFMRRMRIIKMRGAEVPNPNACFSLKNGFKVFPPLKIKKPEKPGKYQPIPDPPNAYSTGIPDLDEIIGGYPKASTILLERDPRVSIEQLRLIIVPTIVNSVIHERPAVIIPLMGLRPDDVKAINRPYGIPFEKFCSHTRIFMRRELIEGYEAAECFVPYERGDLEEDIKKILRTLGEFVKGFDKPLIQMIATDTVAMHHGAEGVLRIAQESLILSKKTNGFALWILESIFPELIHRLSPMASMHLKLTRKHGCLLLYGVKPRTPLLAIDVDVSNGYPMPKLTPII